MEAKSNEIDTHKTNDFTPILFRVLTHDTIYDRIVVTVIVKKTFGVEALGMCVIPSSTVATMATLPRSASVWWPIRKLKDLGPTRRGELLISMSFLDGLNLQALPTPRTLPDGNIVVKVVEAQSIGVGRADIEAVLFLNSAPNFVQRTTMRQKVRMPVWNENFSFSVNEVIDAAAIFFRFCRVRKLTRARS